MAGYDQRIKIKAKYHVAAKDFFSFLRAVGKKYSRPTRINYRYLGRGHFYITIDGSSGGIDALFQELILNKGLYYYICSIRHLKKDIVNYVVIPIFQELLDYRFQNPYSRFVRRHLSGKTIEERYVPGEFSNEFSHEYEILFRKWDLGLVDDWNFIKDLDSLLNRFMLTELKHASGTKSPPFHILVDRVSRKGVGMMRETRGLFNKIHKMRTDGLHRLKTAFSRADISELAIRTHNYFSFFDEFSSSQEIRSIKLYGKRYKRITFGKEVDIDYIEPYKTTGIPLNWDDITNDLCPNCAAIKGQYHCISCNVEQCPRCRGQFIICRCGRAHKLFV